MSADKVTSRGWSWRIKKRSESVFKMTAGSALETRFYFNISTCLSIRLMGNRGLREKYRFTHKYNIFSNYSSTTQDYTVAVAVAVVLLSLYY